MPKAIAERVQENYTNEAMLDRVKEALDKAGFAPGPLRWNDVAIFDQFHVRGLEATKDLAEALDLRQGQTVLDVGCGLGGPARYLAAVHSVQVIGLDLTPAFIEISEYLSQRTELTDRLAFRQGDATELPFPDEHFDVVWTQHVAMNIPEKAKLYKGFYRVLKSGGKAAIYDVIRGSVQPVLYPTPWANDESISFLLDEDEFRGALREAGFTNLSFVDRTELAGQWLREGQGQREEEPQAPNPLSPVFILGTQLGPALANLARNVFEGRVRLVQIVAEKR